MIVQSLEVGARGYVLKPVVKEKLAAMIDRALKPDPTFRSETRRARLGGRLGASVAKADGVRGAADGACCTTATSLRRISGPGRTPKSLNAGRCRRAWSPWLARPYSRTGQINLISLDAVMERLAARWPTRRDTIYDYTFRTLERHIGDEGAFLRVSETDFLITLPHERKFGAQASVSSLFARGADLFSRRNSPW